MIKLHINIETASFRELYAVSFANISSPYNKLAISELSTAINFESYLILLFQLRQNLRPRTSSLTF